MKLRFKDAEPPFVVERFLAQEALSSLFEVVITVSSESNHVDVEALVGCAMVLSTVCDDEGARNGGRRQWSGVCRDAALIHAHLDINDAAAAVSHYQLTLVPDLWRLSLRTNYRIFQHQTVPQIVETMLKEWRIERRWKIDERRYPQLEYRVQYGETDCAFVLRLLEEAGIGFLFQEDDSAGSVLTLSDAIEKGEPRSGGALLRVDKPNEGYEKEYVTDVAVSRYTRPDAVTLTDYEFRNPALRPTAQAQLATGSGRLEQYIFRHGMLRTEGHKSRNSPVADDRGVAFADVAHAQRLAEDQLAVAQAEQTHIAFHTNVAELSPGSIFSMSPGHPSLGPEEHLLVISFTSIGQRRHGWQFEGTARRAAIPYRPSPATPKPLARGPQSAIVIGPAGEEIYADEHGRVRIQFPWNRQVPWEKQGRADERASCWVRVHHAWAGAAYGMLALPRVGQEVLVEFLDGDPDEPVVMGGVYNGINRVPFALPKNRLKSGWRSATSPAGGGYNEWSFDDTKGKEEVFIQAERNLRKWVRHDEAATVGHDRKQLTERNELITVGGCLHEHAATRAELSSKKQRVLIGKDRRKKVGGNELRRSAKTQKLNIISQQENAAGQRRQRIEGRLDSINRAERCQSVHGKMSVTAGGSMHTHVGNSHAVHSETLHFEGGARFVGEANDVTFKAGGSFLRIDAAGVTIRGPLILINSGGTPGAGVGAKPQAPKSPKRGKLDDPSAELEAVRSEALEIKLELPQVRAWPEPIELERLVATIAGEREANDDHKKLTWIAIELVDDQGEPVAGERYEITLPNGEKRTGVTDNNGKAHIEGIDPGTCQVTFPRLDRDIWKKG